MGERDPIETLIVAVEGDVRKLLKDVKAGIVLAEDELTQLSLQPVQLAQDVKAATTNLKDRFVNSLNHIRQAAKSTFERFGSFLSRMVFGYQKVGQAANAATINQQRFNQLLAEGQQVGATLVQELTALVLRLSQASGEPFQNIINGLVQAKQVTQEQGTAIGKTLGVATKATNKFSGALGILGKVANSTFGIALGLGAVQILKKFIEEVRTAVKDTVELQTALVRLQVSVRAAQRFSGEMVGSIGAWQESLEELGDTYQNLSQVEIQQAGARTILLTRQMKFNQEQIQRTLEAAAQLAALYNIDMNKAISLVTQGLTGISRGLRLYGVQLSRTILNEEARRQGLQKSWEEMNAAERASIALEVITKQLAGTTEDLDVIYETLGGRLQAATARSRDAKAEIGSLTAWFKVLGAEIKARAIEALADFILTAERVVVQIVSMNTMLGVFLQDFRSGVPVVDAMRHALEAGAESATKVSRAFGLITTELEDVEGGNIWAALADQLQASSEESLEALQDLAREYGEKFADLQIDLANKIAESWRKLADRLAELSIELIEKQAEAWRKRGDAIIETEIQFGIKLEDIEIRTAERLAALVDQLAEKRIAILAALHKKLRRLQEDFQIASRRSRERFIEDLDDAVANRDAFAAVRLIKKQRREQRELREDFEVKRRRAIEDAQERLAALNGSLEAQRAAILRDRDRAIAAAERWRTRRLADIDRDYEAQLAKLQRWHANKKREIIQDQKEEMAELQRHHIARQIELAAALAEEENITEEGARAIFDQLDKVFGLGGTIEQMMEAFRDRLATRIEIETRVNQIQLGGGLPTTTPMLPPGELLPWEELDDPVIVEPDIPIIPQRTATAPAQRTDTTVENLGVLEIRVSADEHFSADFESMVGDRIVGFVDKVLLRPRRGS